MAADDLNAAFGVTEDDLVANRAGGLSARQRRLISASGTRNLLGAVVGCAILVAIVLLVANRPFKPVQIGVTALLCLALLAVGVYDYRRTRAGRTVERLTGVIRVFNRGTEGWWLSVDDRLFRMPVHFWHLENGARYEVFVEPRSNRIVSMAPAEE